MASQNASIKLLIAWVYHPAVGHLVEALEVAANYHAANPSLEIHILVHENTLFVIGEYCDFIHETHTISVQNYGIDKASIKNLLPKDFDYIVFPKRLKYSPQDFPEPLLKVNLFLQEYFKPKIWGGYNDSPSKDVWALQENLYSAFKIKIPKVKIAYKLPEINDKPIFSVMLKGASKQTKWPSFKTWKIILSGIKKKYPEARFLITGVLEAHGNIHNSDFQLKNNIDTFIASIPGAINCYDIGLENQLAIIQSSNIFIAPHTGFAFLAPCLGTPWLALSGGEWAEEMPAQMPFYSVLPSCKKYPCNGGDMKLSCRARLKFKQPIKCMTSLNSKLDDILLGIEKLLNKYYLFDDAFNDYQNSAISNNVNLKKLWRLAKYNTK
jgi:hypothetical protein